MPNHGERTDRGIGENGRQPTDYASSYWEELRVTNAGPTASSPFALRRTVLAGANDRGVPVGAAVPSEKPVRR